MTVDYQGVRVEIIGQNGEYLCVHGDREGNEGVYLGEKQVAGIYDAPEKQTWKAGARTIGAKARGRKILARDLELGFLCVDTSDRSAEENEAYLIQAIGFELDEWDDDATYAKLRITSSMSGSRDLDIVQYEEPDLSPDHDPVAVQFINPVLKMRSGNPDWYTDDVVSLGIWADDGWQQMTVENPTPRPMMHKWVGTPGTWMLPDFSWRGPRGNRYPKGDYSDRYISCPEITAADGGLWIDTDKTELMARASNDTNILARFGGQFFMHLIPPYTQRQTLPVYCSNVPKGGAQLRLIQPRRWPRPWGGELRA